MTGKFVCSCAAVLLAVELLAPAVVWADPLDSCPGSSYSPCHYNFPLLWNLSAHHAFRWHAAPEPPPPYSGSYYELDRKSTRLNSSHRL